VRLEPDPERGRAAAAKLRALGATRNLIRAAEQGYITQLVCKMPECFCPEELGGACYFVPVTPGLSDCVPTHEHFPISKREGGKVAVDNAILAHRLCNRIDYSITVANQSLNAKGRQRGTVRRAGEMMRLAVATGCTRRPSEGAGARRARLVRLTPCSPGGRYPRPGR